ncbi:MAG: DUF2892 domain-containing protein [Aquificota bacterium]|nr:DUF2892 domain-containing protein [Aquificota bacterium]
MYLAYNNSEPGWILSIVGIVFITSVVGSFCPLYKVVGFKDRLRSLKVLCHRPPGTKEGGAATK